MGYTTLKIVKLSVRPFIRSYWIYKKTEHLYYNYNGLRNTCKSLDSVKKWASQAYSSLSLASGLPWASSLVEGQRTPESIKVI